MNCTHLNLFLALKILMSTEADRNFLKVASATALVLAFAIAIVIVHGDRIQAKVNFFNWEGQEILVSERQIVLSFNREMNRDSIESSFKIEPEVDGKFSWVGRKLHYTLSEPLAYGQDYRLTLTGMDQEGRSMLPFEAEFSSFEKELFYIHAYEDSRRIVSVDPVYGNPIPQSPEDLFVVDFDFADGGNAIVFLAIESEEITQLGEEGSFPELYWMDLESKDLRQLTNDPDIINLSMSISPDGEQVALERLELDPKTGAPLSFAQIWHGEISRELEKFWYANLYPEEFDFTPDSNWLLVLNDQGYSLVPLEIVEAAPQFLGNFISYHGFSLAGDKLAFLQWKDENAFAETNEVIILHRNGERELHLEEQGELRSLSFSPSGEGFYLALSEPYTQESRLYYYDFLEEALMPILEDFGRYEAISPSLDGLTLSFEDHMDPQNPQVKVFELSNPSLIYSGAGRVPRWR